MKICPPAGAILTPQENGMITVTEKICKISVGGGHGRRGRCRSVVGVIKWLARKRLFWDSSGLLGREVESPEIFSG